METGEGIATGNEDLQTTCGFRLVDIYGAPVPNVTVKLSSGGEKQTDAAGCVEDETLEGGVKLTLTDGRRVIFGFRYYQPLDDDRGWMRMSLDHVDDFKRNGVFEDEDDGDAEP